MKFRVSKFSDTPQPVFAASCVTPVWPLWRGLLCPDRKSQPGRETAQELTRLTRSTRSPKNERDRVQGPEKEQFIEIMAVVAETLRNFCAALQNQASVNHAASVRCLLVFVLQVTSSQVTHRDKSAHTLIHPGNSRPTIWCLRPAPPNSEALGGALDESPNGGTQTGKPSEYQPGHFHRWPFGKIAGPGKWNQPQLNQGDLFLSKPTKKDTYGHFMNLLRCNMRQT